MTTASPLLSIEDLRVHFRASGDGAPDIEAVRGASLTIDRGESVALVGESGSGKSVTALSIPRLLPYPQAWHPGGRIEFDGHSLLDAPHALLRSLRGRRIAMIFQEPMSSLNPLHTIEKHMREALRLHRAIGKGEARERIVELLELVQLRDAARRLSAFPHQLSGGQRQRVMIAMALANSPDLLIADEPTTALDVTIQAEILDLLRSLQARFAMALLLITHDLGIVRKMAHRVHVMREGRIVEAGATAQVFSAPEHPWTRHLLNATPGGAPPPPTTPSPEDDEATIRAEHLDVRFPIRRGLLQRAVAHIHAVDDLSLALRAGETLGVVGESGSGKTTLGLALLRLETPSSGSIVFRGQAVEALRPRNLRTLRREMQMVFQDPHGSLNPRMSVERIIAEGLRAHEREPAAHEARVIEALEEVGLDPAIRHRYPHEFSGGQRQRIAIARAIVLRPRFVVLDEPTSALDVSTQAQIVELLRSLQARHRLAYLFISHDLRVVRAMSHHILVLRDGKTVEHGPAERIFHAPREPYTRRLLEAALEPLQDTDPPPTEPPQHPPPPP